MPKKKKSKKKKSGPSPKPLLAESMKLMGGVSLTICNTAPHNPKKKPKGVKILLKPGQCVEIITLGGPGPGGSSKSPSGGLPGSPP